MNTIETRPISNLTKYTESMKKTLVDKIFFIDKVDCRVFVDFGCADGSTIAFMQELFPDYIYIGYDINTTMIAKARQEHPDIMFYDNMADLTKELSLYPADVKICCILNSVIHEVYSYSTLDQICDFYKFIFGGIFSTIVVRDMMPNSSIDRNSHITDVARVRRLANRNQVSDFESIWGSITNNKNLIHFLLKYRYVENWEREVHENYFPIYTSTFLSKIPEDYSVSYYEEFSLPFITESIKKDFKIDLRDTTHVKLIINKN